MTSKEKFETTLNKKLREIKESFMANWRNDISKTSKPMSFDWTHLEQNKDAYIKGGTRKIADAPPRPCQHPEHNPPGMMVFSPGTYEHTCPGCGNKIIFTVGGMYL